MLQSRGLDVLSTCRDVDDGALGVALEEQRTLPMPGKPPSSTGPRRRRRRGERVAGQVAQEQRRDGRIEVDRVDGGKPL